MKKITLRQIEIRNFRSFAEEKFLFPESTGLKLLTGVNEVEPRLGANGAGKSSFWDALFWCLYGSSIKGAKTASVTSWEKENCEVIIQIQIDNSTFKITRNGPPTKSYIGTELVKQEKIDELLGLSKDRFLHSIVFGQGVDLFPDIPVPERGQLLDEVLQLSIWQKASDCSTIKHKTLDTELARIKTDLSFSEGKYSSLTDISKLEDEIAQWEQNRESNLLNLHELSCDWDQKKHTSLLATQESHNNWEREQNDIIKEIKEREGIWKEEFLNKIEERVKKHDQLQLEIAPLFSLLAEGERDQCKVVIEQLESGVKVYQDLYEKKLMCSVEIQSKLNRLEEEEKFWGNDICPICKREITKEQKERELATLQLKKSEHENCIKVNAPDILKLSELIENGNNEIKVIRDHSSRNEEMRAQVSNQLKILEKQSDELSREISNDISIWENPRTIFQDEIDSITTRINPYIKAYELLNSSTNPHLKQIEDLEKEVNPHIQKLELLKTQKKELEEIVLQIKEKYELLQKQILATEYWKHGFKRIRLYFIEKVLTALQIEIEGALSNLGLDKWKVKLSTEMETKSGSIKLGINIQIKSPTSEGVWEVWSGGESQRLRLAIAMGLSSLIQRAAGVDFSFEVWDEPTNWLGNEGIEDLLDSLKYRAETKSKAIWIVDHRALTFSGFKEIWSVTKTVNGSKLLKIAESEL